MKTHFFNSRLANTILFPGYQAITLLSLSFYQKKRSKVTDRCINHESIHQHQQRECFVVGAVLSIVLGFVFSWSWWLILPPLGLFYAFYLVEWMIGLIFNFFSNNKAYHTISLEQEAYDYDDDLTYLTEKKRKPFAWVKYLGQIKYRQ